ncbi:MAG TPA: metallophosphoesterase [Hyphomicrobiaceae bacterium]|nr:metallophosphoesterase [Hyphomicrobiaceae bacterium]
MVFRVAQISDAHLSASKPYFVANFLRVADHIGANGADLVISSGDMSLDGAAQKEDLIAAKRLHARLDLPLRYLAGNHDIGESQDTPEPRGLPLLSGLTRARYVAHFGPDYWSLRVPGWRLLAVNDFLLGSDLPEAEALRRFVRQAAATAAGEALALFTHRPLFHLAADEQDITGRFINPGPRAELFAALGGIWPALAACGHVHQFVSNVRAGCQHVWAPSTGFVMPDTQPCYGLKRTGYVEHLFAPDGTHLSRLVPVPGLASPSITEFPQAYAQYAEAGGPRGAAPEAAARKGIAPKGAAQP